MSTHIVAEPRIAPGSRRDLGLVGWTIAHVSGAVGGTTTPNLFLTLGRHRPLFRGWLRFAARLMPGGTLPRRDTEMVILRVASLRHCDYEFDHHRHLGARAGLSSGDIERIVVGSSANGWTERERAILRAVDDLHERGDLGDDEWNGLVAHLDERQLIELVLLVGHYEMLATAIAALRIAPDRRRSSR